ncbi:MAG: hypothetical protein LBB19_02285 [Puniceicoccales bacterium]|jgi:hypothetical protein|nr:hypothetical protein [Puniceicoccales bacterium]
MRNKQIDFSNKLQEEVFYKLFTTLVTGLNSNSGRQKFFKTGKMITQILGF